MTYPTSILTIFELAKERGVDIQIKYDRLMRAFSIRMEKGNYTTLKHLSDSALDYCGEAEVYRLMNSMFAELDRLNGGLI